MFALLSRKTRSFLRLPWFVQAWFVPLWVLLGVAKLAIFTVSFRRLAPHLGRQAGVAPWVPVLSAVEERRARAVGHAIRLTARYTPWESNCFPQAVAARVVLALYGVPYVMFFGLRRAANGVGMDAHAWVAAGRARVTGGESFGEFTVVGVFVAPGLAAVPAGER